MNKNIATLELDNKLITKLNKNNINKISDLQKLNRADLRNMNYNKDEIDEIIVKLQLIGTDLSKRK